MDNDLISRSALLKDREYCDCPSCEDGGDCGFCYIPVEAVKNAPAVDAAPIEKLGKIGKLFLPYKGCPRGHVGRMGAPYTLEDEALFWGVIEDVDGGRWVPVVETVLHELIEKAKTTACKWISVDDELPHAEYGESDNVLAVDGFGIVKMLYFDGGCWCHPTGETVVYENPRWRITHWMPLPQPPREE